jgi:hypothetical protein
MQSIHVQMMASLVKQLCWKLQDLPDSVIELYRDFRMNARRFSSEDLECLFHQCSLPFRRVFVILDGLDECEEKHRKRILKFVCEIDSQVKNAKIFVASREELDILHTFRRYKIFSIDSSAIKGDIEVFVKHRVASELRHIDSKVQEDVTKTLIEKSNGMYAFILNLLRICHD